MFAVLFAAGQATWLNMPGGSYLSVHFFSKGWPCAAASCTLACFFGVKVAGFLYLCAHLLFTQSEYFIAKHCRFLNPVFWLVLPPRDHQGLKDRLDFLDQKAPL